MKKLFILVLALLALTPVANAEIVAEQVVEQEIVKKALDGSIKLERVAAVKVALGNEVIYSSRFQNKGAEPADEIVMVMPVPKEVNYVEGSATDISANVTFSADGGKTYLNRGRLTVKEEGVERAATSGEISHIKWVMVNPLGVNERGVVAYRGVVK